MRRQGRGESKAGNSQHGVIYLQGTAIEPALSGCAILDLPLKNAGFRLVGQTSHRKGCEEGHAHQHDQAEVC